MDYATLYRILSDPARAGLPRHYGTLSQGYEFATHVQIDPHVGWNEHLRELNQRLFLHGWPPLSAIGINLKRECGAGFWESTDEIPTAPADPQERKRQLKQFQDDVFWDIYEPAEMLNRIEWL